MPGTQHRHSCVGGVVLVRKKQWNLEVMVFLLKFHPLKTGNVESLISVRFAENMVAARSRIRRQEMWKSTLGCKTSMHWRTVSVQKKRHCRQSFRRKFQTLRIHSNFTLFLGLIHCEVSVFVEAMWHFDFAVITWGLHHEPQHKIQTYHHGGHKGRDFERAMISQPDLWRWDY